MSDSHLACRHRVLSLNLTGMIVIFGTFMIVPLPFL
jgi:hypothetical protein